VLTPDPAFDLTAAIRLPLVVLASSVAGAVNSIAGGGTLLTFPALVGLGISPIVANATSTVALWPGALGLIDAVTDGQVRDDEAMVDVVVRALRQRPYRHLRLVA
jgi:uncharacterized membrane protein YfcA